MSTHGLLLAAGAGTREGEPEALLVDDRGSWLLHAVRVLDRGGCDRVTVVVGARASLAVHLLDGLGVDVVVARDWQEGVLAALRAGLTGIAEQAGDAEAALVHLVDLPDVGPDVVGRVLGAAAGPAVLARAAYGGRPGHPLLLGRDHWASVVAHAVVGADPLDHVASDVLLVECGDLVVAAG